MSLKDMDPHQATEKFLNATRVKTGVSQRFLDAARPLVLRAFREVPEERLDECLAALTRAFARQAEIEKLASEAKCALDTARVQILNTQGLFGRKVKQLIH